jgi:hypothetical protein
MLRPQRLDPSSMFIFPVARWLLRHRPLSILFRLPTYAPSMKGRTIAKSISSAGNWRQLALLERADETGTRFHDLARKLQAPFSTGVILKRNAAMLVKQGLR